MEYKKQGREGTANDGGPKGLSARKMSGGPSMNKTHEVHLIGSPQASYNMSNGFFSEEHLRKWSTTRKAIVLSKYETELEKKVSEAERIKKWEQTAKQHKKYVIDSVQHKVREL